MIQYVQEAPAKINLTLRILARRPDGFHNLASLVAFADKGDALTLTKGDELSLTVRGAWAAAAGPAESNLVLHAARALKHRIPMLETGHFMLTKNLPAGAGLGGGSSDAAAALRLLAIANGLNLDNTHITGAAAATGSDVPVCLQTAARLMHGRGETVSEPLNLPSLPAVLVFPGTGLQTAKVFRAFELKATPRRERIYESSEIPRNFDALIEFLCNEPNDLEVTARTLLPVIDEAMQALAHTGAVLVRMSGSGSAVFGLFQTRRQAEEAARQVELAKPDWWVTAAALK